jgi:Fungal specific transcription factor domain
LNIPNPYISALFPLALQNEELFSALVALSYTLRSSSSPQKVSNTEVMQHRSNAIVKLRQKLMAKNGAVDDAMMMAALFLMLLDVRPILLPK